MKKSLLLAALLVPAMALAQTYPAPTFSSLTLQNPLTAANGGTGATTATGTGSVVLSTSPTLTTPNLGTPSAVTLTNGTGLPISTGVSGLGTGVAAGLANAVTGSGSPVLATSPTISGATITGSFTAIGLVTTADLATQAANTVLANVTGSTASPTAVSLPSCSTTASALNYNTSTGVFTCNTAVVASNVSGVVAASNGGTGQSSLTAHAVLLGQGTSAAGFAGPNANSNYALLSNGASADPSFQQLTAPMVNYTATGTGGAARTQASKNADVVSVCDYGACSGGNVTTAVNNAIVAACGTGSGNAFGGLVTFPPGNYTITTGSLAITQGNCFITGAGVDATIITPSGTTGNVFSFTGSQNQGLSNLAITYGTSPTSGAAINIAGPIGGSFHDINISGAFYGVTVVGGSGHVFERLNIINTVATSGVGMQFSGGVQADAVRDTTFNAPAGSQPSMGIWLSNAGGITLDNVDAIHSGTGLNIAPVNSTDVVQWLFAVNAQFDTNNSNGIAITTSNASQKILGLSFVNCWSSSNAVQGVIVSGSAGTIDGVRFSSHRAFNNGQNGIVLNYGANLAVTDSDVAGNSQTTINTYHGITVATSNFTLSNNRVGQEAGFANTQHFGILVNSGAYNFYVIQGNNTQGNNTGLSDNGTGSTKSVTGNI